MSDETVKQNKGFRTMSPERRREVASAGGKKAHANGNAHQWTSAEARAAGLRGAAVSAIRRQEAPDADPASKT